MKHNYLHVFVFHDIKKKERSRAKESGNLDYERVVCGNSSDQRNHWLTPLELAPF